ncbi:MAG: hypothetical protein ACR2IF_12495 [Terriglobales bacterium]
MAKGEIYITRAGLPLRIELEWPFHQSKSGADFYVLHGKVSLANSEELYALVALQLTVTVREVLPSLEPTDTEAPAINTVRKAVDKKEIEFIKSPKRVPTPFNSRTYDFKRQRWAFGQATEEECGALIERKIYWVSKGNSHPAAPGHPAAHGVLVADPVDAQYLDTTPERLAQLARGVNGIKIEGEHAIATPELMARGVEIEAAAEKALQELERKHAFERG